MAVVDPPMVDVLPDKPRTRGIARTKAGKARTATRSVAARCAGEHQTHEPDKNWTQPESRPVYLTGPRLLLGRIWDCLSIENVTFCTGMASEYLGNLKGAKLKVK